MCKKIKNVKSPKLVKGTNVGYEISEIKTTSTQDLKNILNVISNYFNKKTRQKTHNSNFKNLYLRIKKELKERKDNEIKLKKITLDKKIVQEESLSLDEIKVPDFLNDKSVNISSNSSSLFLDSSLEENFLKDEIERLKHEKEECIYQINTFNQKYKERKLEEKKEIDESKNIENEEENNYKSKFINYDDNIFMNFSPIKYQDFDTEIDMNIFYDINSMNNENEEKKIVFGENNNMFIQDI